VGQWAYTLLSQSRGMRPAIAGVVVGGHWAAFTGGRILFGFVADRFDLRRLLRAMMGGTFAGAALFCWNPTTAVGVFGLLLLGFSEAPVFPLLMSGTSRRVGVEHTANAVGLQMVAAGAASAALPGIVGTAGTAMGLESMSACFVVLSAVAWGICLLPIRSPETDRIGLPAAEELRPA
jgi:fucose permease